MKKNILSMAVLLMASAAVFTACSSDDNITSEQPANPTGKYTMTVNASKDGDATTRALTLGRNDANTKNVLNATWDANEVVLVYQGGSQIGTLRSAASATSATTLTGTLDSAPDAGQDLTLYFHTKATPSYTGQDGKLATIASTYDFCAPATITAGSFTVSGNTVSTTGSVSFGANRQSIVKFTLKDKNSETLLNVGTVRVQATAYGYSEVFDFVFTIPDDTYTTNGDGVIYLAIPNIGSYLSKQASLYGMSLDAIKSSCRLNITATVGDDTYTYTKSGWPFEDGKYYEITVKMTKQAAAAYTQLSTITSDYTAQDGDILTGTLGSNVKISIADGATVTLKDVNINGSGTWTSGSYAGITCEGDATITLEGTNTVKGFANGYPGIFVSSGKTIVINGTGELNASSNGSYNTGTGGAGIGAGNNMNCGNIEIQSGTVTATGNYCGAGIGGGQDANCGNITISGGTVTATGGQFAAGIGGGKRGFIGGGQCGNITISGGTITATGGENAAGIGGGKGRNNTYQSSCGTITITSGVTSVTATKGSSADNSIGAGSFGTCGTVTIADGANVTQN